MKRDVSVPQAIVDEDEAEDYAASEAGEWTNSGDLAQQRSQWAALARRTLDGERRRISISIPERDLARLKTRAAEEGMPYQTLINSILHKYVNS